MAKKKPDFYVKDLVIDDEYGIIKSDATVVQAAQKMKELAIPDLVVLDTETDEVRGIIADFDIVQHVVAEGKDPAKEMVTSPMYQIEPVTLQTNVVDAFERMRDLQVNVVPVIEEKKLLGVVTIQDVWSYIPDENVDEIGIIPVDNPKNAEFWFASVCATIALLFGILLPLVGVVGFFNASSSDVLGLISGESRALHFFLFDAHGGDVYISFMDMVARDGIWVLVIIWSFITLITGIAGFFALVYTSFSDFQHIRTKFWAQTLLPLIAVGSLILEWIFLAIAFAVMGISDKVSVNALGLVFSIVAMLMILIAWKRDWIFRQSEVSVASPPPGGQ